MQMSISCPSLKLKSGNRSNMMCFQNFLCKIMNPSLKKWTIYIIFESGFLDFAEKFCSTYILLFRIFKHVATGSNMIVSDKFSKILQKLLKAFSIPTTTPHGKIHRFLWRCAQGFRLRPPVFQYQRFLLLRWI